jgi:hypothetical protein
MLNSCFVIVYTFSARDAKLMFDAQMNIIWEIGGDDDD